MVREMRRFCLLITVLLAALVGTTPAVEGSLQTVMVSSSSDIEASTSNLLEGATWDVLGSFPQQAREQHFLSPGFPFPASSLPSYEEIGGNQTWPSALADGGEVGWGKVQTQDGEVRVSYPDVRWQELRATAGWAALQHHSLLHTTLTLPRLPTPHAFELRITQGSFFCLIPRSPTPTQPQVPEWNHANIYALTHYQPHILPLPSLASAGENADPVVYDLFISADYEIRLFGDPLFTAGGETPVTRIGVSAFLRPVKEAPEWVKEEDVVPDFVDGWAFGEVVGVGLRAGPEGVRFTGAVYELVGQDGTPSTRTSMEASPGLRVMHAHDGGKEWTLAPLQTRVLPLLLQQTGAYTLNSLNLKITFSSLEGAKEYTIRVSLPIRQLKPWWKTTVHQTIRGTYLLSGLPQAYIALPPLSPHDQPESSGPPVILGLHGAGVPIEAPFWPASVDRTNHSWAVFATGGTEWGSDWHGVSARDAWGSAGALRSLLRSPVAEKAGWEAYGPGERTVAIGHSNGGQGVWFLTSRYPDLVTASIPTSAWLTPPHYVPLTFSRSTHFVDAKLRGILDAALMSDGNDLFLSNVRAVPGGVLAVHGGADENVPVWMTREAVGLAKAWGATNVAYHEEPGKPHWWDDTFRTEPARSFLSRAITLPANLERELPRQWVMTVANPKEAGSMYGWTVNELEQAGKLARLEVSRSWRDEDTVVLDVRTTNVEAFTVGEVGHATGLRVNGEAVGSVQEGGTYHLAASAWRQGSRLEGEGRAPEGPFSTIFVSNGPVTIIVPRKSEHGQSVGSRLAHALFLYLRVDSVLLFDDQALSRLESGSLGAGNLVVIDGHENAFARHLLAQKRSAFSLASDGHLQLANRTFSSPGDAILFLHPHPVSSSALALVIAGADEAGLERALRALPLRTGVAVPQWLVLGERADWMGMGGVVAAGWWTPTWGVSKEMSWVL